MTKTARTAAAPRLFCFGYGFSAAALGRRLAARGWHVSGTKRSPQGSGHFAFDGETPMADPGAALAGTTHLLLSVPPGASGDPVLAHHGEHIVGLENLAWLGYLSTTGVYGDRAGGWVDEGSAIEPTGERGQRRVDAEAGWRALAEAHGLPLHIFRLAGIYGPGRSALDSVRRGKAKRIDKPGQVFSRIHVEDIASVLEASIARPAPGAVYNLCDDDPAPPAEVVAHACELLGQAPPPLIPFAEAELSPMGRSFYRDNKRVSNRRIKDELGVTLRYPSYQVGLRALLDQDESGI
ncbi:MAG: SDR family oxidoreductase [Pseudomonadota bacterium]